MNFSTLLQQCFSIQLVLLRLNLFPRLFQQGLHILAEGVVFPFLPLGLPIFRLQGGLPGGELVHLGPEPLGGGQRYGVQAFQLPCRRLKQDDFPFMPPEEFLFVPGLAVLVIQGTELAVGGCVLHGEGQPLHFLLCCPEVCLHPGGGGRRPVATLGQLLIAGDPMFGQVVQRFRTSTDTIISVFSSCSVAIGLAILSKGGNFSKYSSILVGDVLSITKTEIVYLIVIFVVTIVFWVLCFNKLNAICIHRSVAKSKGIHVRLLDNLFAVLVALIVMLSIKWIGILIINALLILPAASSRNISENMREYHFFSVLFSVFSGIVGLAVSYYTNVATGPMIVIIASVIYFSTFIFGRKLKK